MIRTLRLLLPILTLSVAVACKTSPPHNAEASIARDHSSSATASRDDTAQLITTFGEHRIGRTIVEISEAERKFTVKHLSSKENPGGKSNSFSSISPDQWPLQEGWFAYAQQNGAYVWLHNGAGGLLLVERKETAAENATNTYGTNNFPIPIPTTVMNNLHESLRAKLQTN